MRRGFTLFEVAAVIAVIGILAGTGGNMVLTQVLAARAHAEVEFVGGRANGAVSHAGNRRDPSDI
jgi:prepilin-type N-terminal cleavage/methylation domain-containing protein